MNKYTKTSLWIIAVLTVALLGVLVFPMIDRHLAPSTDAGAHGEAVREPKARPAEVGADDVSAIEAPSNDEVSTARTRRAPVPVDRMPSAISVPSNADVTVVARSPAPPTIPFSAYTLAEKLIAGIPPGSRLAVRPLGRGTDGLSREVGRRFYEDLLGAFSDSLRDGITLLPRERLMEVYRSLEEFYQGDDIESLLHDARADVEVVCKSTATGTGVRLSCSAIRLEHVATLATGAALFELTREGMDYELAVDAVARGLTDGAPGSGRIVQTLFLDAKTGAQTNLSQDSGRRVEALLTTALAEKVNREASQARAADALGGTSATTPPAEYRLRGFLRSLDDSRIRLDARLEDAEGTTLVSAGADLAVATIPEMLRPGPSTAAPPGRRYEAAAEAVVSDRLEAASARRATRNLARARVIAQAMALPAPDVTEVTDEVDAVRALGEYLEVGITVNERFHDAPVPQADRIAVRLVAEVVPVGTAVRPPVTAKLGKTVYAEREPMSVELRSDAAAHVGVFSWAADNTVVRLYPNADRTDLMVGADDVVILPETGEGLLMSSPMPPPSNREDHEAIVIVASPERMDFMALAPPVGGSLDETMDRSIDGSDFLRNVASSQPGRLSVLVLPYLVHR